MGSPRKKLVSLALTIKAIPAALVLYTLDIFILFRSLTRWAVASLAGIKQPVQLVQWRGLPSVIEIPLDQQVDFNFWRKPLYIFNTLKAAIKNKTLLLTEQSRIEILPDEKLVKWLTHTPLSRITAEQEGLLVCDLSQCRELKTEADTYLSGPVIRINKSTGQPHSIGFANGENFTPEDGRHWDLAKLHMQNSVFYTMTGYIHGDVHFVMPCAAAAAITELAKNSVLRQLLAPHLRFTLHINNEALRVQRASDKSKPYSPFPTSADEFIKGISNDIHKHLLTPGFQAPHKVLLNQTSVFSSYCQTYYQTIYDFVAKVLPFIDNDEIEQFCQRVAWDVPQFDQYDTTHTLATVIWQVSVLHSLDHETLFNVMELEKYHVGILRMPEPEHHKDLPFNQQELIQRACSADDCFRTKVFAHTFAIGHKHPLWDNSLGKTRYAFKQTELQKISKEFRESLIQTDLNLCEKGQQLTPISRLFQSICW